MSPGRRQRPADLGKAGCSWPRPPAATAGHPAQKGRTPEPLNQIPHHHQGLPAPPPGMIRSRTAASRAPAAPLRGRCAPLDPPARSQNPAAIRDREQTQASPDQGDHDRKNPESNACGHRRMQVRRLCACSSCSSARNRVPSRQAATGGSGYDSAPGARAREGVPWPVRRSPHGERRIMAPARRYSMKAVVRPGGH